MTAYRVPSVGGCCDGSDSSCDMKVSASQWPWPRAHNTALPRRPKQARLPEEGNDTNHASRRQTTLHSQAASKVYLIFDNDEEMLAAGMRPAPLCEVAGPQERVQCAHFVPVVQIIDAPVPEVGSLCFGHSGSACTTWLGAVNEVELHVCARRSRAPSSRYSCNRLWLRQCHRSWKIREMVQTIP